MRRPVVIQWEISSYFGWGIYGLNLALNWATDPDVKAACSFPIDMSQITIDALRYLTLVPFLRASSKIQSQLEPFKGGRAVLDAPVLVSLDGAFTRCRAALDVELEGSPTVGFVFFEQPQLAPTALERARALPLIVTGSRWNEQILRAQGLVSVRTVLQGIDPTLFHPGPRANLMPDRFLIFSGGKLEYRKGQDIVLAAFKRFAEKHPEALLVTAWHSPWPQTARSLDRSGIAGPVLFNAEGNVDVRGWAAANGIGVNSILDLGSVPNAIMAAILREMDVALMPSRAEGGTNLVAMECMACGIPTILSRNTGHLDLIEEGNCYALENQRPVGGPLVGHDGIGGYCESEVEEVIERLEQVYTDRAEAKRRGARAAQTLERLSWSVTAQKVKDAIFDVTGQAR